MTANRRLTAWIVALTAPSFALVAAMYVATSTWERVRTQPQKRTLRVTGSAKQRIVSDLIEWQAQIETRERDRTGAYRTLREHVGTATAYLEQQGVAKDDIRVSSVSTSELITTEYVGSGNDRIQRQVSQGWTTAQTISIRSRDIPTVERVSREITQLLEQGVSISSEAPEYHYTKLGELKIDMLAKAAENARVRADRIVGAAGREGLGGLWAADMGVINVNPANSTATSWEGNNDLTSMEKDIITIVHLTYELP